MHKEKCFINPEACVLVNNTQLKGIIEYSPYIARKNVTLYISYHNSKR